MKFALLAISLFFTCLLSAQTEDIITLWPDKVPNESRPKQLPRQTDNTSNNVIRLTDVTNQRLQYLNQNIPMDLRQVLLFAQVVVTVFWLSIKKVTR